MNLAGVTVPLVTPVTSDGSPDLEDLGRLLNHVIDQGVHGIFLFGSMGLYSHFTVEEKKRVIRRTVGIVKGRIPVLVGTADPDIRQSVLLANVAYDEGADAIVVMHLNNLPLRRDSYKLDYYRFIIEKSRLPYLLCLNKQVSDSILSLDLIEQLMGCGQLAGIKDSSGSVKLARNLLALCRAKGVSLLQGEIQLAGLSLTMGYDGLVPGTASIFPKMFVDLFDLVARSASIDRLEYRESLERVCATLDIYLTANNDLWPGAAFHSLGALGITKGIIPRPFDNLSERELQEVESRVQKLMLEGV